MTRTRFRNARTRRRGDEYRLLTRGITFATERTLRRQREEYMRYYNTLGIRSSLQYLSPLAFERRTA